MKSTLENFDKHHNPLNVESWVLTRTNCVGQVVGWHDDMERFYEIKYPNDNHKYGFIWSSLEVISEEKAMVLMLEQT